MKIDSHNHFWHFDAVRHDWIDDSMKVIQRDFLPEEFSLVLQESGIEGTVVVQVDQTPEENNLLIELANRNDIIKGIVGWVDLKAKDLGKQLEELANYKILKGFRHIAQAESDNFLAQPEIVQGIRKLRDTRFTYDILINPLQLDAAIKLVAACPDQKFVLDHLAKPYVKAAEIEQWRKDLLKLASFENVWCKVSGMVTEADWYQWKESHFSPYLDVAFEAFGSKRLMYGSDWPVCLLAADYKQVIEIVQNFTSKLSLKEQEDFWGINAIEFYSLTR